MKLSEFEKQKEKNKNVGLSGISVDRAPALHRIDWVQSLSTFPGMTPEYRAGLCSEQIQTCPSPPYINSKQKEKNEEK